MDSTCFLSSPFVISGRWSWVLFVIQDFEFLRWFTLASFNLPLTLLFFLNVLCSGNDLTKNKNSAKSVAHHFLSYTLSKSRSPKTAEMAGEGSERPNFFTIFQQYF